MKVEKCKGCGAKILWIKTPTGNKAPVDAEPRRLWVMVKGHPKDVGSMFDSEDTIKWQLLPCYTPHHATCSRVQNYRKQKESTLPKDGEDWILEIPRTPSGNERLRVI